MVSKPKLLLVDGDARTRRVLEVSLRKAGFLVTAAQDASDALQKAQLAPPDLVISDTQLPGDDGFALCQRLKADPSLTSIPFIFLTKQRSIEDKIRGLELGVEEYLTKPIFVKEIVVRIKMLLQRRQRESIAGRDGRATTFSGDLADMAAVDLIQTLELGRKSGIIHFRDDENRSGAIYFRDGKIIDAELGQHQGERAVYRLLLWSEGRFDVEFRTIRRREVIESSNQALLMEGMRRVDEWGRLLEQLPPLESVFEVDFKELGERLGEIPDEMNAVIKLIDGRRTIPQVIDNSAFGDLETLQVISSLFFEGVVFEKRVPSQPTPPWPHVTSDLVDDAGSAVVPGADDTTSSIVRHLEGSNAADDVWDSPTIDTLETSAVPPPSAEDQATADGWPHERQRRPRRAQRRDTLPPDFRATDLLATPEELEAQEELQRSAQTGTQAANPLAQAVQQPQVTSQSGSLLGSAPRAEPTITPAPHSRRSNLETGDWSMQTSPQARRPPSAGHPFFTATTDAATARPKMTAAYILPEPRAEAAPRARRGSTAESLAADSAALDSAAASDGPLQRTPSTTAQGFAATTIADPAAIDSEEPAIAARAEAPHEINVATERGIGRLPTPARNPERHGQAAVDAWLDEQASDGTVTRSAQTEPAPPIEARSTAEPPLRRGEIIPFPAPREEDIDERSADLDAPTADADIDQAALERSAEDLDPITARAANDEAYDARAASIDVHDEAFFAAEHEDQDYEDPYEEEEQAFYRRRRRTRRVAMGAFAAVLLGAGGYLYHVRTSPYYGDGPAHLQIKPKTAAAGIGADDQAAPPSKVNAIKAAPAKVPTRPATTLAATAPAASDAGTAREQLSADATMAASAPTATPATPETAGLAEEAKKLVAEGKLGPASAKYRALLKVAPEHADALAFLAERAMDAGRMKQAKTLAKRLLAVNPEAPVALLVLGMADLETNQIESAKKKLERFLALCPNCKQAVEIRKFLQQQ